MRPYGWNPDGTLIPDEADNIRDWAAHILAGGAVKRLVANLNAAGVPSKLGGQWTSRVITRALQHPRMAGLQRVNGVLVDDPRTSAVLDRDDWDKIVAILSDPERKRFTARRSPALLSDGLLRCGNCGAPMYLLSRKQQAPYACQQPPDKCPAAVAIQAHLVEPEVSERVLVRVTSAPWRAALARVTTRSSGHYQQVIDDIDARMVRLAEEFGGMESSEAAFTAGLAAARKAKEWAQHDLDLASAAEQIPELSAGDIVEWWADVATVEDRRKVIDLVLERVTVKPRQGNPTVADRLEYGWRD